MQAVDERNEYQKEWARKKRQTLKEAGICPRCGKHPLKEGFARCQECHDKLRAYGKERRKRFAELGLCHYCSGRNPVIEGRSVCQECANKRESKYRTTYAAQQVQYQKLKAAGLCTSCHQPMESEAMYNGKSQATCDECRAKRRREKAAQRNWRYPHILERDNFRCQICGSEKRLCVHHIDGVGQSQNGKVKPIAEHNDAPENLITLCRYCHYSITCLRRKTVNCEKAIFFLLA